MNLFDRIHDGSDGKISFQTGSVQDEHEKKEAQQRNEASGDK